MFAYLKCFNSGLISQQVKTMLTVNTNSVVSWQSSLKAGQEGTDAGLNLHVVTAVAVTRKVEERQGLV